MARDEKASGKGRVKFRFIEFEMDGSDATLQNAIQQITHAVGRPQVIIKSAPAALAGPATNGIGATAGNIASTDTEGAELVADELRDHVVDEALEAGEERPRRVRRFKSPKIVDIELRGGEVPLKQFLTSTAPDSDQKRYTLIAYWFRTYRSVAEVTPDHIYTAYREMGWTTLPKDTASPLRGLAKIGWFEKGQGELAYALNHIGEGKALDMVNKAKRAA